MWCKNQKMNLNNEKCVHVRFTRNKSSPGSIYIINSEINTVNSSVKYLGVMLSSDLIWKAHVEMVTLKAVQMLNFIRRNFGQGSCE